MSVTRETPKKPRGLVTGATSNNIEYSSNGARRYDDGCHVSRPLLLVACTFMAQDADATTACSSAVSTHVGVL